MNIKQLNLYLDLKQDIITLRCSFIQRIPSSSHFLKPEFKRDKNFHYIL